MINTIITRLKDFWDQNKYLQIVIVVLSTSILGVLVIATVVLMSTKKFVAPNVPASKPRAASSSCVSTITIASPTSTPTSIPTPTPTSGNLSVDLVAIPPSGMAPFSGVSLSITVSGTATGLISFNLDCTSDGSYERMGATSDNPYTSPPMCDYPIPGTYTAAVLVNRQGYEAQDTTQVNVLPSPTPVPCTYQYQYKFPNAGVTLPSPQGMTIDSSNNIYVTADNAIYKFNGLTGDLIAKWGSLGSGDNQFNSPYGIAYNANPVGGSNNLYVADRVNRRIQVVNANTGAFVTRWALSEQPYDVAVNPDPAKNYIYVSENIPADLNGKILKFNTSGSLLETYTRSDGEPEGLVVDSAGNLLVVDDSLWWGGSIRKYPYYSSTAIEVTKQNCGSPKANFYHLSYAGIDSQNNHYVPELWIAGSVARVNRYFANGQCATTFGTYGTNDDQFQNPQDVVVDSRGYVFVLDADAQAVKVFSCVPGGGMAAAQSQPSIASLPRTTRDVLYSYFGSIVRSVRRLFRR